MKKYIFCIRHGERTDHVGLIPKLYKFDPELTEKGKLQAKEVGLKLKQKLQNELNINSDSIVIISSPFGRTLQTSKQILHSITKNNATDDHENLINQTETPKIYVNNLLSEIIEESFCGEFPKDFLTIYSNSQVLEEEFLGMNLEFMHQLDKLPTFETKEECQKRMELMMTEVIENFFYKENKDAIVLVSHGSPIDFINRNVNYPGEFGCQHICYCATYIYSYDMEKKEFCFEEKIMPDEFENKFD